MEGNNYSLSDIAALSKHDEDGFLGGGSGTLIILFLFLMMMGGGGIFGNRNGELGQYATAASQQQILFNQQFDQLGQKINAVGDGLCSSTYTLNNAIAGEGRALQMQLAETTSAIHSEGEQTRALLQQNKIETLQGEINKLQLAQAMCGVVRYPNAITYSAGSPCGCGCSNV